MASEILQLFEIHASNKCISRKLSTQIFTLCSFLYKYLLELLSHSGSVAHTESASWCDKVFGQKANIESAFVE